MDLVQRIKTKRIIFAAIFIVLTLAFYLINLRLDQLNVSEPVVQYVILAERLAMAALYFWFGYTVGINKQTTWFMSMLAVFPVLSWLGLMVLLFKSGKMQLEAGKGTVEVKADRNMKSDKKKIKNKKQ